MSHEASAAKCQAVERDMTEDAGYNFSYIFISTLARNIAPGLMYLELNPRCGVNLITVSEES